MDLSEDRGGLEAKLLVLEQQRSVSRRKCKVFCREFSAEGKADRSKPETGRMLPQDGGRVYSQWCRPSSSASRAADLVDGLRGEKNKLNVSTSSHISEVNTASLSSLRSICCSDASPSLLGESSMVPRFSRSTAEREHRTVEACGLAEFDLEFPPRSTVLSSSAIETPAQGPPHQQQSRELGHSWTGICSEAEQESVPAPAEDLFSGPRNVTDRSYALADDVYVRPEKHGSHSTIQTSLFKGLGRELVGTSYSLTGAADGFFLEEESFPPLPPQSLEQQNWPRAHHSQGKVVRSTLAAEERRRSRRRSLKNKSEDLIELGPSSKHETRHGASLTSVSMDAGVPRDPVSAIQTPTRRVPGSGCRLPPELTYFDWQEELDSVHVQAPGGVTWDPQLEHYFAAVAATRSAARGQRNRDSTPQESSDAAETDGSMTGLSIAGDGEEKGGFFWQLSLRSDCALHVPSGTSERQLGARINSCHSRESSASGASITSVAVDEGTSTSTSSIRPQRHLPLGRQLSRAPASLKDWMETFPVPNVAQLTLSRRSMVPVTLSDKTPGEGRTSSASDCDTFLSGAGQEPDAAAVRSNQDSIRSKGTLVSSPSKEEQTCKRKVGSAECSGYASEACTSSPSEQEDSVHRGGQFYLRTQPSRLGCSRSGNGIEAQAWSSRGSGGEQAQVGVLNAAQMILARQRHQSPSKGSPAQQRCVYSDYVASDGCTTSSASECEATFRGRHFVSGNIM